MADYFKIKSTTPNGKEIVDKLILTNDILKVSGTKTDKNQVSLVLEYYFTNGKMPTSTNDIVNIGRESELSNAIQSALQVMYDNNIDPEIFNNRTNIQISRSFIDKDKYKEVNPKSFDENTYNQLATELQEGGHFLSGDNDWSKERTFILSGNTYTIKSKAASSNGVSRAEFNNVLNYYLKNGTYPTDVASIGNINDPKILDRAVQQVQKALAEQNVTEEQVRQNIKANGGTIKGDSTSVNYEELNNQIDTAMNMAANAEAYARNQYWDEIFNRNGSGLGADAYNNMVQAEINVGRNNIDLANAQIQQQGLAQAATVKSIVDQVRNERMARLRAGMSESQIANQDMQNMIANQNALNDQIVAGNMAKLQGQQQIDNAQTTAYTNWLNSMNQSAQAASAFAAADAGDLDATTKKIMANTGMTYKQALSYASGNAYKQNQ